MMLIMTRRAGEGLQTGAGVDVRVLGIQGNQVRIGIDAPKDCWIHREEIFRRCADAARSLKVVRLYASADDTQGVDYAAASQFAAIYKYRSDYGCEPFSAELWQEDDKPYPVLLEACLRSQVFPRRLSDDELRRGGAL